MVVSFFLECEMFSLIKKFHNKKSSQNERPFIHVYVWDFVGGILTGNDQEEMAKEKYKT